MLCYVDLSQYLINDLNGVESFRCIAYPWLCMDTLKYYYVKFSFAIKLTNCDEIIFEDHFNFDMSHPLSLNSKSKFDDWFTGVVKFLLNRKFNCSSVVLDYFKSRNQSARAADGEAGGDA